MDQGCHPYPSRDASLTAKGASLNLIPIPNPFKILSLGMMFRFGNYNNLKCGRGGFGVRACPLKAPLVKHCTSKKAQSGRTAAQRGRTAAQRGRTAVQLLFLPLDRFWWEQHSAGSISSAGRKSCWQRALLDTFCQLLFLHLDTFWWEQYSAYLLLVRKSGRQRALLDTFCASAFLIFIVLLLALLV